MAGDDEVENSLVLTEEELDCLMDNDWHGRDGAVDVLSARSRHRYTGERPESNRLVDAKLGTFPSPVSLNASWPLSIDCP